MSDQPPPADRKPPKMRWETWVERKIRESMERGEFDRTREKIAAAGSEAEVRRLVAALNERIVYVNTHTTSGPATELAPLHVERVVEQWRRGGPGVPPGEVRGEGGPGAGSAG